MSSAKRMFATVLRTYGLATLALLALASPAAAQSAWWHLSSGSRPASLQSGIARNEVQQITVSATSGSVVVIEPRSLEEFFEGRIGIGELKRTEFEFDATHEAVQAALESVYGAGNVEVSGGPGDATGASPYTVAFEGALGGQPVPLMNTAFSALEGEVTVSEVTAGRADGIVVVTAENVGETFVEAGKAPVHISDVLPSGLRAVTIEGKRPTGFNTHAPLECRVEAVQCTLATALPPFSKIEILIGVDVEEGAKSGEQNEIAVTGGKAAELAVSRSVRIGPPPSFGVETLELTPEDAGGETDTQAGSHPFQLTTTLALNQAAEKFEPLRNTFVPESVGLAKDLRFKLPTGLIGNSNLFPKCTIAQFLARGNHNDNQCAPQAAVGVAAITYVEPAQLGLINTAVPVFNIEPAAGEPARFGFYEPSGEVPVVLDTSVRTGSDYGVTVSVNNITQTPSFISSTVTFWGVPGDPRHDAERGWGCLQQLQAPTEPHAPCAAAEESAPPAFLSLPTSCTGELQLTVDADSWEEPGNFASYSPTEPLPALDGCDRLPFSPSIQVAPDRQQASTPSGMTVKVHMPQADALNATGLAPAAIRDTTVTLPQGVTVNPSSANGLQACSLQQIGLQDASEPSCPDASKVATAEVRSPLLPDPLVGEVYLATQNANPFNTLLALYLVVKDPVSGVLVKLAGKVIPDAASGQLVSTFQDTPQLPFEDLTLHFFGGEQAPLAMPPHCGAYTTAASFGPWSGKPAVESTSSFLIATGPGGGPCPDAALPFAAELTGGALDAQAGAYSPLSTTISRPDGDQDLQRIQLHTPPGLSGVLKGVKLCDEADANAGTCGHESLIGHTTVAAGLGETPVTITGGQVFLTEGYEGAPFGLSVVTPAKAGPFDLGNVVVRARIEVDQQSAALTVTSGAIPHILDGVPIEIKHVNVTIDRPGFTFNPTNCSQMAITGTVGSVEGASAPVSMPFEVVNCATLKFAPKFSVSTSAKATKRDGTSLTAKLSYPNAPQGTQAEITRVKVELPRQLPSRLETLQEACVASVFAANPANCPAHSIVGHATVTTPLLPVPLTGPAYFVSHGGEQFPSLTMVLQGYGVTIQLVGQTFIKKGITSTTFASVPDVPFSKFELTLPKGRFSALGANGNLCKTKLFMPTEFKAQNGAEIHQRTRIAVVGCGKAKKAANAHKDKGRKARRAAGMKHGRHR